MDVLKAVEVQGVAVNALTQLLLDKGVIRQEELDSAINFQITGLPHAVEIQSNANETDRIRNRSDRATIPIRDTVGDAE